MVRRDCQSLEEAKLKAQQEAADITGITIPVMVFRQGMRYHLTGALRMPVIAKSLHIQSAEKKSKLLDARLALNRPEDPTHTESIAKYVRANLRSKYILPPLTLNLRQRVSLYTPDYPSEIKPGYLVIPDSAALAVTDGQHRYKAIRHTLEALDPDDLEVFSADAVAVMITCESEMPQIHQDFADCSQTKPLPKSQVAIFDQRNPANRLLLQMESRCMLFKNKVDPTSTTLSKKSTFLFLANQVRQLLKELLVGSSTVKDDIFEKSAIEQLGSGDDQRFEAKLMQFSDFINYLTEKIELWNLAAAIPPEQSSQIIGIRGKGHICLTATGLNVIGRVGHILFTNPELEPHWREYADRLAQIDWSRTAPIWQGTIVVKGKMQTQNVPLKRAVNRVLSQIELADYAINEDAKQEEVYSDDSQEQGAIKELVEAGVAVELAKKIVTLQKAEKAPIA